MNQRHPWALVSAWLGVVVASLPMLASEVPVVRFVEVGDSGVVFAKMPFRASLEITTSSPFRGSLVATYRWTEGAAWTEGDRGVRWGDRVRVPLDLKPGTERFDVSVPSPSLEESRADRQTLLEAVWVLEGSDGTRLASGRQPAQPELGSALRILRLTTEPGEGHRRAPAAAWTTPDRYQPYATAVATRDDLAALGGRQRQALFDAVALGLTLVVTTSSGVGPIEPLGAPFEGVLSGERVLWKGTAGEEIREAPLLWGRIRRTTLAATPASQRADGPDLVRWMLLTSPRSRLDAMRVYVPDDSWHFARFAERARSMRLGVFSTESVVVVVLVLLFAASGELGPPRRLLPALALAACLAAPPLVYVLLAGRRAGNSDWRFRVTAHDGVSPVASLGTYASGGGGGGSRPVSLSWRVPGRGLVASGSPSSLTFAPAGRETSRATSASNVAAPFTVVLAFTRSLVPPDPAWETDVRWEKGRLSGTLTARRTIEDAWILGLSGVDGGRIGPVPAGGRVDLSSVALSRGRPDLAGASLALRRAWMGRADSWLFDLSWTYWAPPDLSASVVASEEPAEEDGTGVYDYQGLRPAGGRDEVLLEMPTFARGSGLRVAVPVALALPDDTPFYTSRYPWADQHLSRAERFEESRDGTRTAIVPARDRALEGWKALRPDLPRGAGYVGVRSPKGG